MTKSIQMKIAFWLEIVFILEMFYSYLFGGEKREKYGHVTVLDFLVCAQGCKIREMCNF